MAAQLKQPLLAQKEVTEETGSVVDSTDGLEQTSSFRVSATERKEVEDAMEKHSDNIQRLEVRMQKLGLQQEYEAYKDRYLEWRKGMATGARGEMIDERVADDTFGERGLLNARHHAANRGHHGFWFPTVQEWVWKRTMSYWIAVTFFEGSIFFCISSFLYNQQDRLGPLTFKAMTIYGYVSGKICFFICTYFMCLETVNFSAGSGEEQKSQGMEREKTSLEDTTFYLNPFRYQTAFRRLGDAGVWKLPYITSATYFFGVLFFTVGLAMEFTPACVLPTQATSSMKSMTFIIGSLLFAVGGFVECIQNFVNITRDDFTSAFGFIGACGNLVGGVLFVAGSLTLDTWRTNFLFGVGSATYMAASSLSIIMWKDEQFGLTFLAVLNSYHKRKVISIKDGDEDGDYSKISLRGCIIVQLCCWTGAVSTYNFFIEIEKHFDIWEVRSEQVAFNEFIPCVFSHMMLLLMSAVMRPPKGAPFKQLYVMLRLFCVAMALNSSVTLWEFIRQEIEE